MENQEVRTISIEEIVPNRFQPRELFGEKELNELANSIKEHGIIQPLILRRLGDKYEIIAGERRYKAASIAGLYNVPAIIVDKDDNESAELAIIENIQRQDLTPIEEARSYQKLLNKGLTQEDIARKLGISQPSVANKIRLLSLPQEVQDALLNNRISERHARSLLKLDSEVNQVSLLNRIINEKLTVRQTEEEINNILGIAKPDILTPSEPELFEVLPENNNLFTVEEFKPEEISPKIKPVETKEYEEKFDIEPIEEIESFEEELNDEKDMPKIQTMDNQVLNTYEYLDIVDKTRKFVEDLVLQGKKVEKEEYDMDNEYQFIIRIEK